MPDTTADGIDLITLLEEHNKTAIGYLSDEVSVDQDSNLERYLGKPYGDEEEGRSTAISMDVAEVVDWAMPDLLEPFLSGDRVVEFDPSTEADEAWTDQAADLANHVFWRDNAGVIVLHDTVKTACIQRLGIIKTVWGKIERTEEKSITGLAKPLVDELAKQPDVEILKVEQEPLSEDFGIAQEAMAAFSDGMVYTVKFKRRVKSGRVQLYSVPPEEFKVSSRQSSLERVEYCCHETEKRRSELIAMGFDRELVMSAKSEVKTEQSRSDTRFDGEQKNTAQAKQAMSDILQLKEEYLLADLDGEGEKCWQINRVGKVKLSEEVVDEHPFDAWSPDRIPHRLIGLGLADKVKQTQRIKTHLTRNMLDNVYLANNPRIEVPAQAIDQDTIGDLLTYRIGGLIRTKQPAMLRPIEVPDRSAMALNAIMYMDGVREQQSGITRNGAAIQSEVLDAKSAYQARKEDRNEQVRKRLMSRMLAETLLVPVFRKVLRLIVRHQDEPRTIKLRGKWVKMDPRDWNADVAARVSVGLGYTNREEELQACQIVGQAQMEAMQHGIVGPEHLFATFERMVAAVGWQFPAKYAHDPNTPEGQQAIAQATQAKPDPRMVEVQAKGQLQAMQAQHQAQLREAETVSKLRMAEIQAQIDQQTATIKAASERQVAEMRARMDAQVAAMQAAMEERLAIREQDIEARLDIRQQDIEARTAATMAKSNGNGAGVRFGGRVG